MAGNLPPGCNTPDGITDHALEAALERLCDKVQTPEIATLIESFIPVIEAAYEAGFKDGIRDEQFEANSIAASV